MTGGDRIKRWGVASLFHTQEEHLADSKGPLGQRHKHETFCIKI